MPDPRLRLAALEKLRHESLNVQAATTLATLAPTARRASVTDAGIALQIAYDYLDLVTEQPVLAGDDGGLGLLLTLAAAMDPCLPPPTRADGDSGYLRSLLIAVQDTLRRLPNTRAVIEAASHSVRRCAEGQVRAHAAGTADGELALKRWASSQPEAGELGWRELAAGASASVLCLHALTAAATDLAMSTADAASLQTLYLSIGTLTMLDSVVDRDLDAATGTRTWSSRYESEQEMAAALASVARRARSLASSTPEGAHHLVTLAGVVAYYATAAPVRLSRRGPIMSSLRRELGGALRLTLLLMRLWRAARSVRRFSLDFRQWLISEMVSGYRHLRSLHRPESGVVG